MATNLLAMSMTTIIIVSVSCGVGLILALAILYGVFRKFSRMSWGCWQLLVLFGLFMAVGFIPIPNNAGGFAILVTIGLALIGGVLGLSAYLRSLIRRRVEDTPVKLTRWNRFGGAMTGIFNVIVIILVFGGFALAVLEHFSFDALDVVYSSSAWGILGGYAGDFLFIAVLTYAMKAGYRLGIGRFLWVGFTLLLAFVAVFGSILMVIKVPFLVKFSYKFAALFHTNAILAAFAGHALAALVIFIVFLAAIIGITILLNMLFKKINTSTPLNLAAGIILAILFYLVIATFMMVGGYGIHALTNIATGSESDIFVTIAPYLEMIEKLFSSSRIGGLFYTSNPLNLLVH